MGPASDLAPGSMQMPLTKARELFLNENWSPPNKLFSENQYMFSASDGVTQWNSKC